VNVYLKKLRKADLDMVAKWRMSEDVTKYMNTDPVLTFDSQLRWFENISGDETQRWWVINIDGQPVGVLNIINIDECNKKCEWGYYVAIKEVRSMKLAVSLEWNLYDHVFYKMGMNRLYNVVLSENEGVVRLHQICGSRIEGELQQSIFKRGQFYDVTMCAILKSEWEVQRANHKYERIDFE
jgi:UDP-4-amino-4,6-dideoxy-N-acetyl-beta-L-altrosamine N-acetyltransferase